LEPVGKKHREGIDKWWQITTLPSMSKTFRPYELKPQLLLPPNLCDWVPEGHLALFILDVVEALDLANASKHKAMSYERMTQTEKKLEEEVAKLLAQAQAADAAEDQQYSKDRRGDELPAELARRESRLAKIREAKAALEQEAKERAAREAEAARAKIEERRQHEEETGKKVGGRRPRYPTWRRLSPHRRHSGTSPTLNRAA
jgi:hypothetical protein